ncbi:LysR family transcriptional regulator [Pseudaquabacterium rugosum]|uniref:LysR family transcriptional regulator n=1 Tax=Pseudaquabacterium rugosum TaxID=2984194 RepID=A0ABU9BEJ6_9BURK
MTDPLEQLRLRDLGLLDRVAELGSLRRVAESLHVTQPAVTQMLAALERAMGCALVLRGRRGVTLTPAGTAALQRLRAARQELHQARAAAQAHERPVLRLGCTPIASLRVLPQALERLMSQTPHMRLLLSEAGVGPLWQQLLDGELDALIGRLPADGRLDPALCSMPVGEERLVLVAGRHHPLAQPATPPRGRRAWQQALSDAAWVLPPDDGVATRGLREWLAQGGFSLPPAQVTCGAYQPALNLVAQAPLLALVPEAAAAAQAEALGLVVLRAPWPAPVVQLVLAARAAAWEEGVVRPLRGCFGVG